MEQNKRNVSIQLIRIVAMFMIVADHMLCYCNFPMKSFVIQIANSGVFVFLFISGLLFGKKEITNWKQWFLKRGIRILIPFWFFVLIDFIIEGLVWNNITIKQVLAYAFNLQGLFGIRETTKPLWFLTLLMICYLITPALYKLKRISLTTITKSVLIAIFIIIQLTCSYYLNFGLENGHTVGWCLLAIGFYALAFFVGDKIISSIVNVKGIVTVTIFTVIVGCLVILANKYIDGTKIYDIISWYGYVVVDCWIITILYAIGKTKIAFACKIVINFLDKISYEFYLIHGLIIHVIINYLLKFIDIKIYILLTIVLSIIGATIIHYLTEPIIRLLNKKIKEE